MAQGQMTPEVLVPSASGMKRRGQEQRQGGQRSGRNIHISVALKTCVNMWVSKHMAYCLFWILFSVSSLLWNQIMDHTSMVFRTALTASFNISAFWELSVCWNLKPQELMRGEMLLAWRHWQSSSFKNQKALCYKNGPLHGLTDLLHTHYKHILYRRKVGEHLD